MTAFKRQRKISQQSDKITSTDSLNHADSQPQHTNSLHKNILRTQAVIGNKAVQRLLQTSTVQRQDTAAGDETFPLREWTTKLQAVKRTKEQNITKVKDKAELNIPEMPALNL